MNVAMLLALLMQSGVCAPTEFHAEGGAGLRVIVCPLAVPAPDQPQGEAPAAPPAPAEPPHPPERRT